MDAVLRPRMVILRLIYDKFKGKRAYHEGVDEMPMSHWTTFVTKMYLVNKEFTIRKARIIFAISRLGGVDDYAQQVRATRFNNYLYIHIQSMLKTTPSRRGLHDLYKLVSVVYTQHALRCIHTSHSLLYSSF